MLHRRWFDCVSVAMKPSHFAYVRFNALSTLTIKPTLYALKPFKLTVNYKYFTT